MQHPLERHDHPMRLIALMAGVVSMWIRTEYDDAIRHQTSDAESQQGMQAHRHEGRSQKTKTKKLIPSSTYNQ